MDKADARPGSQLPTLLDIPANVSARIEWSGQAVRELGYYVALGLRVGSLARVLAKYPERDPRFVEVELENELISLPVNLASQVRVRPICAT